MKTLLLNLSMSVLVATSCFASASQFAIVGGKVHTLSERGTLDEATVLIKDGVIEAIVEGASAPRGYESIDATGKVVTPGLIGAYTSLGLKEVGMSAGVVDSSVEYAEISETGAAADVSYAFNMDSTLIPVATLEGFTSAATVIERSEYLFHGQGAIASLNSPTVMKPRAFVAVDVSHNGADHIGESRAMLWPMLMTALQEAELAERQGLSFGDEWDGISTKQDVLALVPVISGDIPLLVKADRKADILQVLALQQRFTELDLVLTSAIEGWRVAEQIAAADVPVILDPEYNLPGGFDRIGATMANAGRLASAGVTVAIGMESHQIRLATQHAGNAVANGLAYDDALAAISRNVAEIYGVDDQLGAIAPGMQADIVVWSGDPLQVTEAAEHVFIKGEPIEMRSRQTDLRDRYLQLETDKPKPYIRP